MSDSENLSQMGGNARRNLREFGVDVDGPRGYTAQFFVSPELTHALQTEGEPDVMALVRRDNTVDDLDISLGTYDYRNDRIGINHGTIKAILLGLAVAKYATDLEDGVDEQIPLDFYETMTRNEVSDYLSKQAVDEWERAREQAIEYGLDPNFDLNVLALMFDLVRNNRAAFEADFPIPPGELDTLYAEQVTRVLEHELLHKNQAVYGIPPHIGEIVCTIWSVERSPIYQLLDEITDEDLSVSALVVDAMEGYEQLGYTGIAADSVEFVRAYEEYRASQRKKLQWLISLQYEFVPQGSTEEGGILRPIIKGIIIAAAAKAVFG